MEKPISYVLSRDFMLTEEDKCPYLPHRRERKVVTVIEPEQTDDMAVLNQDGFRRSYNFAYRPACQGCHACISVRVVINEFHPTKSQSRISNKNQRLAREISSDISIAEHFELFHHYVTARHWDGNMALMPKSEFQEMIEGSPIDTKIIEWRENEELICACMVDFFNDGISLVYSYFNPSREKDSLGTYMILDVIALAQELGKSYVYLGYWVKNSVKMNYKMKFKPLEGFSHQQWHRLKN